MSSDTLPATANLVIGVLAFWGSLLAKLFRIRTYEKRARNPLHEHFQKTQHLKSFGINTSPKKDGRLPVTSQMCCYDKKEVPSSSENTS